MVVSEAERLDYRPMGNAIPPTKEIRMATIKRIVLDVLKPHSPNVVEFTQRIADENAVCRVQVTVAEMDEKTESLVVVIEGESIEFEAVDSALRSMGASLHSIDEVEVSHDR
jgi:hypothetical protein